ncbi:MAG TPA: acyltransferase [Caulifigura sp.]|nr:acyltransferase [Caulifigura sp.]
MAGSHRLAREEMVDKRPPQVSTSGMKSGQLPQLDVVRGIAILLVLWFHDTYILFPNHENVSLLFQPLTLGWFGVPLFFALSGFVNHHSTLGRGEFRAGDFYWRRFWRIYPPYAFAMVTLAALQWQQKQATAAELGPQLLVHALMIHNFFDWSFIGINPSFWSLAVEVQFYLMYPVLLVLRRRCGLRWMLAITLGFSVLVRLVPALGLKSLDGWFTWALGMAAAERFHAGARLLPRGWLFGGGVFLVFGGWAFYEGPHGSSAIIGGVLATWIVEFAIWSRMSEAAWSRWLARMGVISYSIYLMHQPLIWHVYGSGRLWMLPGTTVRMIACLLATTAFMFLLGSAMYSTIELGGIRLGSKLRPRGKKPATSGAGVAGEQPSVKDVTRLEASTSVS